MPDLPDPTREEIERCARVGYATYRAAHIEHKTMPSWATLFESQRWKWEDLTFMLLRGRTKPEDFEDIDRLFAEVVLLTYAHARVPRPPLDVGVTFPL